MTVAVADRATDLLSLVRRVVSLDATERSSGAEWTWARTHSGGIVESQQIVLGQLCIWAWSIEDDRAASDELLRAVSALEWVVAPPQALGFAAAFSRFSKRGPAESPFDDLDELQSRHPDAVARLLDVDACGRAVDLTRGLTSTDSRERLGAARLCADVVASPSLTDDEAECFSGLLSYAVVVESDSLVRHEQAVVLGIAAHHGRLSDDHRHVAEAADLTDAERSGLRPSR